MSRPYADPIDCIIDSAMKELAWLSFKERYSYGPQLFLLLCLVMQHPNPNMVFGFAFLFLGLDFMNHWNPEWVREDHRRPITLDDVERITLDFADGRMTLDPRTRELRRED